jgi:histone deacetylase 1/2
MLRFPPLIIVQEIPVNEYYEYFGPDYELDVKSSNTDDMNTPAYLDRVKRIVMENLRHTGGPPSVQMSGRCFVVCILAELTLRQIFQLCPSTRSWTIPARRQT